MTDGNLPMPDRRENNIKAPQRRLISLFAIGDVYKTFQDNLLIFYSIQTVFNSGRRQRRWSYSFAFSTRHLYG